MTVNISDGHLTLAPEQATQAGYAEVGAYLEALIEEAVFDFPVESREEVIASIREGRADIAAGRSRPLDEVMADIARKHGFPLPDESRS